MKGEDLHRAMVAAACLGVYPVTLMSSLHSVRTCSREDAIQNRDTGWTAPAALPLGVVLVIFGSEVHVSEFSSAHGRAR